MLVLGLGPIGEMCTRIAQHQGAETVIGIDLVPERLARANAHGVDRARPRGARRHRRRASASSPAAAAPTAVIDAVGMEAHGAPIGKLAHRLTGLLPDIAAPQG